MKRMKTMRFISVIAIVIMFLITIITATSCEKDDPEPVLPAFRVISITPAVDAPFTQSGEVRVEYSKPVNYNWAFFTLVSNKIYDSSFNWKTDVSADKKVVIIRVVLKDGASFLDNEYTFKIDLKSSDDEPLITTIKFTTKPK
jgi:hypothetical protein